MSESHPFDSGMLAEMLSGTETSISPQMVEENSSNGFEDLTSSNSKSDDLIAEIKTIRENIAKENALSPMKVNPIPRDVILYIFHQERNEGEGLRTTYVGLKQSYSRQPLSDLKQINISQMWVRKRHEGCFLLCRIITPPSRKVAIGFGVEDVDGNAAQLFVYNFPTLTYATTADLDAIFSMGTILAIREPTYKLSAMNSLPVLLVDSPSDIVFLDSDNSILRRQTWGSATIGRTPTPHTSAEAWRASGVTHFRAKRWLAAAVCFSNGIKLDPNEFILRLNRSEVYIRMGWYKSAFQDAEKVLLAGNNVDDVYLRKAVFRAAKSLYHLGEYNMAIDMANRRQRDDECQTWYTKASDRLHEQLSGEYDWNSLFQQSQASFEQVEMAEFTGPVQVRDVNGVGGGRGIFVNRDVKAGELLMVSKAIATGSGNPQHDQSTTFINCITNDVLPTRTAAMRSQLIERLWEDSRVDLIVQALYAGSDCPPPSSYQPLPTLDNSKLLEHPLRPSTDIDITRLDRACTFNGIGLDPIKSIIARSKNDFDPELDCVSGIFSLPSLCNHSCLPSAHWSSFGKFICIRANRNLRKDDEVTIQYFSVHASFENRTQNALHWGFTCHCVLCEMDRADGEKACKEREEALSLLRQDFDVDYDDSVMQRALKLADDVRRTYRDHEKRGQCNVKPARFIAHDYLAALYTERILTEGIQFFKPSIEEGMKAIEAVGVVILDKSISGKVNCESSLPIDTTRGPTHMKDECLRAVLHIVVKFYTLGELRRAELWLKTAVYLEDIHIGGGWQLFQSRHHMLLQEIGLTKFARFIFS